MLRQSHFVLFGIALLCLVAVVADRTTSAGLATPAGEHHQAATRTALIDMAKVFKNNDFFNQSREELKEEISGREAEAVRMANGIKSLQNQLKDLEKGSDVYVEVEAELKRHSTSFEEFRKNTQKEILKSESKIYHRTYQLVEAAVQQYADEHDLDLVLRFSSEPLEEEDPQKLIQGMNRQVVYQRNLDITDEVMAILKNQ